MNLAVNYHGVAAAGGCYRGEYCPVREGNPRKRTGLLSNYINTFYSWRWKRLYSCKIAAISLAEH